MEDKGPEARPAQPAGMKYIPPRSPIAQSGEYAPPLGQQDPPLTERREKGREGEDSEGEKAKSAKERSRWEDSGDGRSCARIIPSSYGLLDLSFSFRFSAILTACIDLIADLSAPPLQL